MKLVLVLVLVLVLGCSGHKDKPSCKAEVDELMTFLRAMDHSMSLFSVADVELVMRPELTSHADVYAPVITIKPDVVLLDGKPQAPDELSDTLSRLHADLEQRAEQMPDVRDHFDPTRIYLVVDARTTWKRVGEVARAAGAAQFTNVGFVFGKPSPVKPPARTSVDDKLDAVMKQDPGERASQLAGIASDVIKPCAAMNKVFGAVGGEEVDDKAQALIDGTGPALLECNCNIDMPAIRTVMWRIVGNPNPTFTLDVTLNNEATALSLPYDMPWREASKHIAPGATLWPVAPVPRPPPPRGTF